MSEQNKLSNASEGPHLDRKQIIKLMIELGPLLVFFITNSHYGIFAGTAAFMAATVVSLIASHFLLGRVATMPLVTGIFVLVFGGLTIYLQDDHFIKLKPTIVNGLFGAILLGGLMFGKLFLKIVFGDVMHLTEDGWRVLTIRWALFFFVLAVLNEVVWRAFSTDTWVTPTASGIMPLTFVFAMAQPGILKKYDASGAADSGPQVD